MLFPAGIHEIYINLNRFLLKMDDLRHQIIDATINAIQSVKHVRFFKTERGYQGRLFCALQHELDKLGIMDQDLILEMEYQKSTSVHGTGQRPDIILHVPTEVSGADVDVNNVAVWALKRKSSKSEAKDDFGKLNAMFGNLRYKMGFFINIDSERHHMDSYIGGYKKCITAFCVKLVEDEVSIRCSFTEGGLI